MHLPHLRSFDRDPIIFLTTCVHNRHPLLASAEPHAVLHDIWTQSAELNGWFVGEYLLMPDHLHLFAACQREAIPLADWMRLWKSIGATRINRALRFEGKFWQTDYFDRFIRSLRDYSQKWEYVAANPVRKGLVKNPEDWPYRGRIYDLRYRCSTRG